MASSRILVIGGTGYIGQFIVGAAVAAGHSTYALIRSSADSDPARAQRIQQLKDSGVHIIHGCVRDHQSLVNAMRDIDVVISVMGGKELTDQLKIVDAIKELGDTVKRFLPSEFGHDIDRAEPVEPGLPFYNEKRKIRRAIEAANIPFTYICCNSIAGWPYFYHIHPPELPPPTQEFEIYGDGNVKAYFVTGADIGKYTIKTVDDVRTLNKYVHFRPSKNFLTLNELACIWEKKIGKNLPRVYISEQELLHLAEANNIPESIVASLTHDIFIKGCQYNFEIDRPHDVEVSQLYPEISYTSVEDFFDEYLPLPVPSQLEEKENEGTHLFQFEEQGKEGSHLFQNDLPLAMPKAAPVTLAIPKAACTSSNF
uniref:Leucoanthocyanidin reductase 2 n=1 Tax=Picea abies TaxID=3329 RepID=X2CXW7_PICAB|nr:leucoanthocyanidin reductase 2 [Picea abies]